MPKTEGKEKKMKYWLLGIGYLLLTLTAIIGMINNVQWAFGYLAILLLLIGFSSVTFSLIHAYENKNPS